MTTQTLDTVLRTVRHYKLLSANQTLIVGVSGGTDSLALLHILLQLRSMLKTRLHVATLNHGIRGASAEEDVGFVQEVAKQWHIPYTQGSIDVPQLAQEEKIGIEEASRKARYKFLAEVAQSQSTNLVAVGHHANDQAETILMHMIRGSGLNGLRGMQVFAPMPDHESIMLVRPLLHVKRLDLEQYCIENALHSRHDVTNDEIVYQRNYVRHEIIPRLEQINPNVVESLSRLAENATVDDDYLSHLLVEQVMPHVNQGEQRWSIFKSTLLDQPKALQRRFVIHAFYVLNEKATSLGADQVTNLLEWIQSAKVGMILNLGKGIQCRVGYDQLFMELETASVDYEDYVLLPRDTDEEIALPKDLSNAERHTSYNLTYTFVNERPMQQNDRSIALADNVTLRLRTRRNGDRFRPKGMSGHSRKLKDWMIDRKVPRQIRDRIPLITMNEEIIAIRVKKTWHFSHVTQDYLNENCKIYLILN